MTASQSALSETRKSCKGEKIFPCALQTGGADCKIEKAKGK